MIGKSVAHYQITALLGKGGMGEVYRATDTKLKREVALKMLPEQFCCDAQRMSRFRREAEVLASLNHANIGAIYGLEDAAGQAALVLELLEGPTLAERIEQGAIPLREALEIGRQIAIALEAAHRKGIIHRDLKPANIKITPEGQVKVLDFGLAKAGEPDSDSSTPELTRSPTLSLAATASGIILGTAGYMSPEQAQGLVADQRSDVWSLGVVLFEMLAGRRVFDGENLSMVLAHVLSQDPDWTLLPKDVPWRVRDLLERCLRKDVTRRLQAVGDARIVLAEVLEDPESGSGISPELQPPSPPLSASTLWKVPAVWAALALAAVLAVLTTWSLKPDPEPESAPLRRLELSIGADASLATLFNGGTSAVLSPYASLLAFVAVPATGPRQLYVRRLDQLQATPLVGTEGARQHFFSPDGKWIAFFADGKLKTISVTGGSAALTLCDASDPRGGDWAEDGSIVFAAGNQEGLSSVSAEGGTPEPLTYLDGVKEVTHRWPQVLAGGQAVLFTASTNVNQYEEANLVVQRIPDGQPKIVHRGGYHGLYSVTGHLIYVHEGSLFAVPFDLGKLETEGQPTRIVEDIRADPTNASAQFALSRQSSLVYRAGVASGQPPALNWLNRDGELTPLGGAPVDYAGLVLSPDGQRFALQIQGGTNVDIWLYEWERESLTRQTFHEALDTIPVWSPAGESLIFSSNRESQVDLYWIRADGSPEVRRLLESPNSMIPTSWHPSGNYLAIQELDTENNFDIRILPLEGDDASGWTAGPATTFVGTPYVEFNAIFSPDGHWLAYSSNESGEMAIYVQPFPGPGGKFLISRGGGGAPVWSRQSKELFYLSPSNQIMVVSYSAEGKSFVASAPRVWTQVQISGNRDGLRPYALHPDGERFAVPIGGSEQLDEKPDRVILIENVSELLRAESGG